MAPLRNRNGQNVLKQCEHKRQKLDLNSIYISHNFDLFILTIELIIVIISP